MTRTTAAAAPAPRNGRNGKVRTVKVDPATLATATAAELAAPSLPDSIATLFPAALPSLPDDIAAALASAKQEAAQRREKTAKVAIPRVSVTAHEAAALASAGWKAPYATADNQWKPQPRGRANSCKGDVAYSAAVAILAQRPLSVADLAALWIAAGNAPRALGGVAQQIANRASTTVSQKGGILSLI